MATMEDRLRTTLRERVGDVTTEPALYRRVHERADRFRRRRLFRLVPAGVAAFGLAVAVPFLLQGGPEVPRIEDLATPLPVSATTPERVVTVDASGAVDLVDVADGTTERAFGSIDLGGALPTLAVAPSDRSRIPAVVLGTPQDTPAGRFLRHHRFSDESLTTTEYHPGDDDGFAPWFDGGFVLSPDGRWLATFTQAVEGDGYLTLQVRPTDHRASTAEGPEMHLHERTSFPPGSVLQDWTGSLAASGGLSQVTVLVSNGQVVGVPLLHSGDEAYDERLIAPEVYERSTFEAVAPENSDFPVGRREVAAYASSHLSDDVDGGTAYVVTAGGGGTVVQAVDGERVLGQVDVTDLIGDQEPSTVALDAWGDAATLATREGSWLLTHDGDGRFAEPLALPDGTVRAAPVGRDVTDVEATDEVEGTAPGEEVDGLGSPPLPIVQADARSVRLRPGGDAADVELFEAADDGWIEEVAVRPGSTVDDLTVAVFVTDGTVTTLRRVGVVDGQIQPAELLDDDAVSPSVRGPDVTVHGLAWTPDGAALAWLERSGEEDVATLRIVGWRGGPGTAPIATGEAAFGTSGFEATGPELADIVDVGDGRLVARFAASEGHPGWWHWPLEAAADGVVAPVPGAAPELVVPPVDHGEVLAVTGADEQGQPTWLLNADREPFLVAEPFGAAREIPVPREVVLSQGAPFASLHELGDGVLLSGANRSWFVDDEGWIDLGTAADADPVR